MKTARLPSSSGMCMPNQDDFLFQKYCRYFADSDHTHYLARLNGVYTVSREIRTYVQGGNPLISLTTLFESGLLDKAEKHFHEIVNSRPE